MTWEGDSSSLDMLVSYVGGLPAMYAALIGALLGYLLRGWISHLPVAKRLASPGKAVTRTRSRVIAHRCAGHQAPENTMAALKKATLNGADGIEVDVYLTKDLQAVLMHDETLERTTNGSGLVRNHTHEDLSKLNAAHNFPGWGSHESIPLVSEMVEHALQHGQFVYFDMKDTSSEAIRELTRIFEARPELYAQSVVCAFNYLFLYRLKLANPHVQIAPIWGGFTNTVELLEECGYSRRFSSRAALLAHPLYSLLFHYINPRILFFPAVLVQHDLVDRGYRDWWGDTEVIAWTVNDQAVKKRLTDISVSYITDTV